MNPETTTLPLVLAIMSLVGSFASLAGLVAIVVRLFTRTEVRVDRAIEDVKEIKSRVDKQAEAFNVELRASGALATKVGSLESKVSSLATVEAFEGFRREMAQGMKHLEDLIKRVLDHEEKKGS